MRSSSTAFYSRIILYQHPTNQGRLLWSIPFFLSFFELSFPIIFLVSFLLYFVALFLFSLLFFFSLSVYIASFLAKSTKIQKLSWVTITYFSETSSICLAGCLSIYLSKYVSIYILCVSLCVCMSDKSIS